MVRSAEAGTPVVEAAGLSKVFRDFWMRTRACAVDGIDFRIEPGAIFGMLGPNGSGKSTTIKMILGLLRPSAGRLTVFGRPPSDVAIKRHIGFLPEESYFYRFLTPLETLDYYGQLFKIPRKQRQHRSAELLEMVGLSAVAHRHVGEFSKGMTRRIGLAQALINDPDLLILDEPTSGLDPIGTRQVKELLTELRSRGKTILLSSHLLGDVQDVCDDMVMLYGGRIRARGSVDELLSDADYTVIKTPTLSPETIERVEAVLREAGTAIESVETPRQRLEDLFMKMVEEARIEHMATSGAVSGGTTAEFLRSEAPEDQARAMLDALEAQPMAVESTSDAAAQEPAATGAPSVVEDLMTAESPPSKSTAAKAKDTQPDTSLIEGLVDVEDDQTESPS